MGVIFYKQSQPTQIQRLPLLASQYYEMSLTRKSTGERKRFRDLQLAFAAEIESSITGSYSKLFS